MKQNFGVLKLHSGMVLSTFVFANLIVVLSACSRKGTPATANPVRERSAVDVRAGQDAVRVDTTGAQFVLLPTGYLQATLGSAAGLRTIDDPSERQDPRVIVGSKEVGDFFLDFAGAKVSGAAGK